MSAGLYTFSTKPRFILVRWYRVLSSPWVILLLLCALVVAAIAWASFLLGAEASLFVLGVALVISAAAAGLAVIFAYGVTYFPYAKPPQTVTELLASGQGNVADAAFFDCVRHIGSLDASAETIQIIVKKSFANPHGKEILNRLGLDEVSLVAAIETSVLPALDDDSFSGQLLQLAASMGQQHISIEHIQAVFLLHPNLRTYLRQQGYTESDISFVIWWQNMQRLERDRKLRWWSRENMLDFSGVGLSWASGYTPFVDQFARLPQGSLWDLPLGHEDEVEALIDALARQKQSNVLVVGIPGAGRYGVIKEVADRVAINRAHRTLNGQRVMYIHVGQLLGLAASGAEQITVITRALNEMERAGNVIAIIDGISSVLGSQGAAAVNLTDVIMPFFSSGNVRVVVIMSTDEYHLRFKSSPDLLQLFEVVHVDPLDQTQTLQLLALSVPKWEARTGIYLPYQTLRAIVRGTENVMPEIPFPEKAFDILEEALVQVQKQGASVLDESAANSIISKKVGFNVGRLAGQERRHLLNLEDLIHQRVVNQENGVKAVTQAMIRARAGVRSQNRPIGTFAFLGPTGVGKTETSKALAEAYFGSEEYLQRLDMSEYQGPDAVGRLIGTAQNPSGRLTSLIADRPFTVLLLDEFEKSDRNVHQLFLQIFDEGRVADVRGRQFSFRHAILIATSNAGAEYIRQHVGAEGTLPENFDQQLRDHILSQGVFAPELLNRFDGVITFTPLTREHIRKIARLMLRKLNKRLDDQHGITVAITSGLIDFLISRGYNPEFGARPMNRAIQDHVEYAVAQKILRGEIEPGQQVNLHLG